MSIRNEIAQAIHDVQCGVDWDNVDCAADEQHLDEYRSMADAALAIVRAHRDRLADELEAEAEKLRTPRPGRQLEPIPSALMNAIAEMLLRDVVRLRALYEEQPK